MFFFNPKTKHWTSKDRDQDGKPLERAFNMFFFDAIMNYKKNQIPILLEKLKNVLKAEKKKDLEGKALLKVVIRKILTAADALLEIIVIHLPSPVTVQAYRGNSMYEGHSDDPTCVAIKNCDPKVD